MLMQCIVAWFGASIPIGSSYVRGGLQSQCRSNYYPTLPFQYPNLQHRRLSLDLFGARVDRLVPVTRRTTLGSSDCQPGNIEVAVLHQAETLSLVR